MDAAGTAPAAAATATAGSAGAGAAAAGDAVADAGPAVDADTVGLAAACTGAADDLELPALPFTVQSAVTSIPFCSASSQLVGETAGCLSPVVPSRRT